MQLINVLAVGVGGSIGALLRYGISLMINHPVYPVATFVANIIGSFILGMIIGYSQKNEIANHWLLFASTGMMGSLTTMSTFAVETLGAESSVLAVTNIAITLIGILLGAALGKYLGLFLG